jgi:hypothetical protein
MDDRIVETIARNQYSTTLDASIFLPAKLDEIILCLNYDGLYGINNINRFYKKPIKIPLFLGGFSSIKWATQLFNESDRFTPVIYYNIKGWIAGIQLFEDKIHFDMKWTSRLTVWKPVIVIFELLENSAAGRSVIRFTVDNPRKNR